jgi:serine protease inhibitor
MEESQMSRQYFDFTGLITDYKTVDLDRPFVYMLVDCEQQLPFFIGCMMDPEA